MMQCHKRDGSVQLACTYVASQGVTLLWPAFSIRGSTSSACGLGDGSHAGCMCVRVLPLRCASGLPLRHVLLSAVCMFLHLSCVE
jgi:hypothetical protein